MDFCTGRYYCAGKELKETAGFDPEIFETGRTIYEVLRVIDGYPVFYTDHIDRLKRSAMLAGLSLTGQPGEAGESVRKIIQANRIMNGNLRLIVHEAAHKQNALYCFSIPFAYPVAEQYKTGVAVALYPKERISPNIKQFSASFQKNLQDFIRQQNAYEAILVNQDGYLTEGSRSNIFFVIRNALYTAPDEMVLMGITRQKVIMICKELNFKIFAEPVSINGLIEARTAFLTGTSPKVLPVARIGPVSYKTDHPMMRKIMEEYDRLVEIAKRAPYG